MVDVKSINPFMVGKLPDECGFMLARESPLFQKYPKYVRQSNTYMGLAKIYKGCILFQEKSLGQQKFYWLLFDELLFEETLIRAGAVYRFLEKGLLHPTPEERQPTAKDDKVCAGCDRRPLCRLLPRRPVTLEEVRAVDKELRGE